MSNCEFLDAKKQTVSLLAKKLTNELNNGDTSITEEQLLYIRTNPIFKREFGDAKLAYDNNYEGDFSSMKNRVDENGEPKLFYNETANKHYFLDKNNQEFFFPLRDRGLRNMFSNDNIKKIVSSLANTYIKIAELDLSTHYLTEKEEIPGLKKVILLELENQYALYSGSKANAIKNIGVKNLIKNIDELVNEVDNYFKRSSIIIEENDVSLEEIEDTSKDPLFNANSIERSSKDSISANVKLTLSFLENPKVKDPIFNKPTFIKFNQVYNTILKILPKEIDLEGEDIWDIFKAAIKRNSKKHSFLQELYKKIDDVSFTEEKQNEFIQAFRLNKNDLRQTVITSKKGTKINNQGDVIINQTTKRPEYVNSKDAFSNVKATFSDISVSDSGSKSQDIKKDWYKSFSSKFLTDKSMPIDGSKDVASKILTAFTDVKKEFESSVKELKTLKDLDNVVNRLIRGFHSLGIDVTADGIANYLDNYTTETADDQIIDKLRELINVGISVSKNIETSLSEKDKEYTINKLFQSSLKLIELTNSEAFILAEGSDSTARQGNKELYVYSYESYLSIKIEGWKKSVNIALTKAKTKSYWNNGRKKADPTQVEILLNSSEYNKGSFNLKYLSGIIDEYGDLMQYHGNSIQEREVARLTISKERLSKFNLSLFNQSSFDGEYVATSDLSILDYAVDEINKVLKNSFSRTLAPADKKKDMQISTGVKIEAVDFDGTESIISKSAVKMNLNYFISEYNRMIVAANQIVNSEKSGKNGKDLDAHYHYKYGDESVKNLLSGNGNAFKSQYFERLSPGTKNLTALEKEIHDLLYNENGFPKLQYLSEESNSKLLAYLDTYISTELLSGVSKTFNSLSSLGIIDVDKNGNYGLTKVDADLINEYKEKYSAISPEAYIHAFVTDYYINGLQRNIEYSKMFTGDVAYYKNGLDFKKRIPATYIDGLRLRVKQGQENFTIATVRSIYRPSPFLSELKKIYKDKNGKEYSLGSIANKYGKDENGNGEDINSADGQAWITPDRWKFLMQGLGKWKDAIHGPLYQKMISSTPVKYTEKELKIAAQPLKGVYFGRDKSGKPVFLKYSQAVLTKQLVANTDLKKILGKMTSENIDEVLTFDAIKVGSITPTKIEDGNGNILDDFQLNKMELNNRDWKLQQDLPTKSYKFTDVGSQIQKNIFAGLNFRLNDNGFLLDGEYVTGQNVMDEIVKTVTGLTDQGLINLKKDYGIDENYQIKNIKPLYAKLIVDLEKRGSSQNLIDALKAELLIPGIPQAGSKIINMFMSSMNDRLIKIKTNGGSFIQVSNFGINKSQGNKAGIKWAPYADSTTNEPIMYVGEDGKVKVKPGGVLIPAAFIAKYIPNWKDLSSEQIFGTYEGDKLVKQGIIDSKILDNIIGYRIPNQGLASNDSLRIVGILPEDQGDSIVAYTGITTKTGSDFDIDKMYIMFPSVSPVYDVNKKLTTYAYKNLRGKTKEDTIENINKVLEQLDDIDVDFNSKEFAEALFDIKSVDDLDSLENGLLKDSISYFVEVILKTKKKTPLVDYIKDAANLSSVERLKFVDSKGVSKDAMANRLIELYKSVLTHPEVYIDTMKPIDIPIFKDEIKALNEVQDNLLANDVFDPIGDIRLRYDYLKGVAGIGMEANALVDSNRPGNLSLINFNIGWGNYTENGNTKFDDKFSEELSEQDLNYYVEEIREYKKRKKEDFDEVEFREMIKKVPIGDSLTAVINAFVDITADAYITKGNWNIQTTNVGNLLLRGGMHPLFVTNYLSQPILKEYIEFLANTNSLTAISKEDNFKRFKKTSVINALNSINPLYARIYKKDFAKLDLSLDYWIQKKKLEKKEITEEQYQRATAYLKEKEKNNVKDIVKYHYKDSVLTNEDIELDFENALQVMRKEHLKMFIKSDVSINKPLKYFRDQITGVRNNKFQLAILEHFKKLSLPSSSLRDNVMVSKLDTTGGGKNINSLFGIQNLKNDILRKQEDLVDGNVDGFESKFKNTTLEAYEKSLMNMIKIVQSNPSIFPQGTVDAQEMFNDISYQIYRSPASNEKLMDNLEISYNTYLLSKFFNLNVEEANRLLLEFPKKLNAFMIDNKDKYFIFEELKVLFKGGSNKFDEIVMNNKKKDADYQNSITESWEDLRSNHPEIGEDLIKYAFLTSGYKMHKSQFFVYTPYNYFVQKNINKFVNEFIDTDKTDFIELFFRNNFSESKYITKVVKDKKKYQVKQLGDIPSNVAYLVKSVEEPHKLVKLVNTFYELKGFDEKYNLIYVAINPASLNFNGRDLINYNDFANISKYSKNTKDQMDKINSFVAFAASDFKKQYETIDVINEPVKEDVEEIVTELVEENVSEVIKELSPIKRKNISEKYTYNDLLNNTTIEKSGYKVLISEYPNVDMYITKDESSSGWKVELSKQGLKIPLKSKSIKDMLEELTNLLNTQSKNKNGLKTMQNVGLFTKNQVAEKVSKEITEEVSDTVVEDLKEEFDELKELFKEFGIENQEQINTLSEEKQNELIERICNLS